MKKMAGVLIAVVGVCLWGAMRPVSAKRAVAPARQVPTTVASLTPSSPLAPGVATTIVVARLGGSSLSSIGAATLGGDDPESVTVDTARGPLAITDAAPTFGPTPTSLAATVDVTTPPTDELADDATLAIGLANQAASDAWAAEHGAFNRDDLELSAAEQAQLDEISRAYQSSFSAPIVISSLEGPNPEYQRRDDAYRARVRDLLGDDRFARAVEFQDSFNAAIRDRFGPDATLAGFDLF